MAHQFGSTRPLYWKWLAFKSFVTLGFFDFLGGCRNGMLTPILWSCAGILLVYNLACEFKLLYDIERGNAE